jgi:hypothetical protein
MSVKKKRLVKNKIFDEEENSDEHKKTALAIPNVSLNKRWGENPDMKVLKDDLSEINKPMQPKPQKTKSFSEVAEK